MNAYDDELDLLVQEAQVYVSSQVALPLDDKRRKAIVRTYVLSRAGGFSHREAKRFATASYSSVWLLVASVVLQILFYLLKKFWDRKS